jgi:putative restriction endonuclease
MEEYDHINDNSALLKELGLLTDDEQSKKRRLADYTTLQFFDYEQCFAFYAKRILNIRQAKIRGEVIVAKPVLLLSLIDSINENVFIDNEFELNEWLEERYLMLMRKYTRSSQFSNVTGIENPFWHLATDGFWTLQYRHDPPNGVSPSKRWLKDNVEFAYFDESLWILFQNKVWRTKLRDYIIEHKLTDDFWSGKMAAEGFGILAAILLAA